jgi:hypothetical protein
VRYWRSAKISTKTDIDLAHDRRRILHFAVTAHPTAEWLTPREDRATERSGTNRRRAHLKDITAARAKGRMARAQETLYHQSVGEGFSPLR